MTHYVCNCGAEFNVVFEEHSSYEDEEVNYCPVCGEPLGETWFVEDEDEDDETGFDPDAGDDDEDDD